MKAENLLTPREVAEMLGVCTAHFVRRISKTRGFPRPFAISPRRRVWNKTEIVDWIEARRVAPDGRSLD